jgi:formate-dependent nitrite reductase membrane component NrfD
MSTDGSSSYYSRPVLKEPVWTPAVAIYFFTGGLAGASAVLAFLARSTGNRVLARRALIAAFGGVAVSAPLLVVDLGRPERFLNMLRVAKPTSPMSVGSWVLTFFGASVGGALAGELFRPLRPLGRMAGGMAALLGLPLSTYTAVLVADTSVPVWHEARRQLPFVFVGSAASAAGGLAAALTPARHAAPARKLAVLGALTELAAVEVMERQLGGLAHPFRSGRAAWPARIARAATSAGAALMLGARRKQSLAAVAGSLLLCGSLAERFAVLWAGRESTRSSIGEQTVKAD